MANILLICGLFLIKVWAIEFFGYQLSGMFHILPVIAVFAILTKFFFKKALIKKHL